MARSVANQAGGDFYTLDDQRGAGRVLLALGASHFCLDFTQITGSTLEEDLLARDFTVNALALDLDHPDLLIDPSGGLQDLKDGVLRLNLPKVEAVKPRKIAVKTA